MIDHCISSFLKDQETQAYRNYVTETLKIITENTAKAVQEGRYIEESYTSIYKKNEPKKKEKTKEEIISGIDQKLKAIRGK